MINGTFKLAYTDKEIRSATPIKISKKYNTIFSVDDYTHNQNTITSMAVTRESNLVTLKLNTKDGLVPEYAP